MLNRKLLYAGLMAIIFTVVAVAIALQPPAEEKPAPKPKKTTSAAIGELGQVQAASAKDLPSEQKVAADKNGNIADPTRLDEKDSKIVSGEVIIKLREGASPDSLKTMGEDFSVKSVERVFKDETNPSQVLANMESRIAELQAQRDASIEGNFASLSSEAAYRKYLDSQIKQLTEASKGEQALANQLLDRRAAGSDVTAPRIDNIFVVKAVNAKTSALAMAEAFKDNPDVEYAEPNYKMKTQMLPNDPYYSSVSSWGQGYDDLWGLKKIQSASAWDTTQGQSVVTAVVDTGVDRTHEDLAANMWVNSAEIPGNAVDDDHNGFTDDYYGWDFIGSTYASPVADADPTDFYGHGTHVAGTIAAVGNNSKGIIGVAPQTKIMAVRALDNYGNGNALLGANAIKYAADMGARVVNNSWGGPGNPSYVKDAIDYASAKGCLVVVAAGNSNADSAHFYPANVASAITVAASTQTDAKAPFSNFGGKIDVAAPGGGNNSDYNVLSLLSASHFSLFDSYKVGTSYARLAGTSMASPHVAGLAALVIAKNPTYTTEQVRYVLRNSTDDVGTAGWDSGTGFGRINAYKAVTFAATPPKLFAEITAPSVTLPAPDNYFNKGVIYIKGTANGADFSGFTVSFAPEGFSNYSVISSGSAPVANGLLAVFDSTSLPNGKYTIKLTVQSAAGTYTETRTSVAIDSTLKSGWPKAIYYQGWPGQVRQDVYKPSVCFADLEGDGNKETLTVEGSTVYGWTKDGAMLPGFPIYLPGTYTADGILGTIAVANIDSDTALEIIVGAGSTSYKPIYAYKKNGTPVPGFPAGNPGGLPTNLGRVGICYAPVVTDLDRDGKNEIITLETSGNSNYAHLMMVVLNGDGTMRTGWPKIISDDSNAYFADWVASPIAAGDMDGDGQKEIVVGTTNAGAANINMFSADGQLKRQKAISTTGRMISQFNSSLVLGDCDADGQLEILIPVYRTDTSSMWTYVLENDGQTKTGWPKQVIPTSASFANIESGPQPNIVIYGGNYGNTMYVFRSDGTTVPGWPKEMELRSPGSPAKLFDVPVFGRIAASSGSATFVNTWYGAVQGYDSNGAVLPNWPKTVPPAAGAEAVGDLENDGKAEIGIHSLDGMVYLFQETAAAGIDSSIGWPTPLGNAQRTGVFNPVPAPPAPSIPTGPATVDRNTEASFSASSPGLSQSVLSYTFDWGDGTMTSTPAAAPGAVVTAAHTWTSGGTFQVRVKAIDVYGSESTWSAATPVTISNIVPLAPAAPTGPAAVTNSVYNAYTVSTTDPEGDQIKYTIDWGDGTSLMSGTMNSGTAYINSHRWSAPGDYYVKARATDTAGGVSDWSEGLKVTVSDSPPQTPQFLGAPSAINKNVLGTIYLLTQDYNFRNLQFVCDWGDGTTTTTRWYTYNEYMMAYHGYLYIQHAWPKSGTFTMKIKAVNTDGMESGWSSLYPVKVSVPNTPSTPSGNVTVSQSMTNYYTTTTTDPDADMLNYTFNWGDGTTTVTPTFGSGAIVTAGHAWTATGAYQVTVKAVDKDGAESNWSSFRTVNVIANNPPATPVAPAGPVSTTIADTVSYSAVAVDPDAQMVQYSFDWGDGTNTKTNFTSSGAPVSASHRWGLLGTYQVRVQAIDVAGAMSAWSPVTSVNVSDAAPQQPQIIIGGGTIAKKTTLGFTSIGNDYSRRDLMFVYDWGDGESTETRYYSFSEYMYPMGLSGNAFHSWSDSGVYNVRVMAINTDDMPSVWSAPRTVTVTNAAPTAPTISNGTPIAHVGMLNDYTAISTDLNGDILGFTFDWGDGSTDDIEGIASGAPATIRHSWRIPGTYLVKAQAFDTEGRTSEWSADYTVTVVNDAPEKPAALTGRIRFNVGESIEFSSSAVDPEGQVLVYEFDFGDGTTAETGGIVSGEAVAASHAWTSGGTYYVKVKATDELGAESEWSDALEVTVNTVPATPAAPEGETSITIADTKPYTFVTTDPDGDALKYSVDWGDGTTSSTDWLEQGNPYAIAHRWALPGAYSVKVQAFDSETGAPSQWSPALVVTVADAAPQTPMIITGGGTLAKKTSMNFASIGNDYQRRQMSFIYDWGDGTTTTTRLFSIWEYVSPMVMMYYPTDHSWAASGTYSVRVKTVNTGGLESDWSSPRSIVVTNAAPAVPTVTGGAAEGNRVTPYMYTAVASDPNGDDVTYTFDWGDGTYTTPVTASGTPVTVGHTWANLGTYNVKVKATDSEGVESGWSDAKAITIINRAPATPAAVTGNPNGFAKVASSFSVADTDPDYDMMKYTFEWGDGTTSETPWTCNGVAVAISHTWAAAGTYQVRVKATDTVGAVSGWSPAVTVTMAQLPVPVPDPAWGTTPANKGVPLTYYFFDRRGTIVEPIKFVIDWGDSTLTTTRYYQPYELYSMMPVMENHTWTASGTFLIKVKGVIANGTESTWSLPSAITVVNRAPAAPPAVVGTSPGFALWASSFSATAADPDGDKVKYTYDWGDGTTGETALVASGSAGWITHTYTAMGTFAVKVKTTDSEGMSSGWSPAFTMVVGQMPVPVPSKPTGAATSRKGVSQTYNTTAKSSPAVEPIKFVFDWGDGTTTTTRYYTPAEIYNLWPINAPHAWAKAGTYAVKVKGVIANGTESAWSVPLTVVITNN